MKYINAKKILPDALIIELQKYVSGEYIYIPTKQAKRWGEISGYRAELNMRNDAIVSDYKNGASVAALAEHYSLSESAIRKILYRH